VLAEEIMSSEIFSVNDFDSISDVLQFLSRRKIHEVVVVDLEQRPIGYFLLRNFFQQLIEESQREVALSGNVFVTIREKLKEYAHREVSEFLEKDFDYLEADESLEDVLDLLLRTKLELVPVIKENKVVGTISRGKFLQILMENK